MLRYLRVCPCVFWHSSSSMLEKDRLTVSQWNFSNWLWIHSCPHLHGPRQFRRLLLQWLFYYYYYDYYHRVLLPSDPACPPVHRRAYRKSSAASSLATYPCRFAAKLFRIAIINIMDVKAVRQPHNFLFPLPSHWLAESLALFSRCCCHRRSVAGAGPIDDIDATSRCWQSVRKTAVGGDRGGWRCVLVMPWKGKKVQSIVREDKDDKERPGPDNNVAIVATTKSIVGQFSGFASRIIPRDKSRRSICISP